MFNGEGFRVCVAFEHSLEECIRFFSQSDIGGNEMMRTKWDGMIMRTKVQSRKCEHVFGEE